MPALTLPTPLASLRATVVLAAALLAGCASEPSGDISLPVSVPVTRATQTLQVEPVKWTRVPNGCRDACPRVRVDSVAFPGDLRLTALVDHALAIMTSLEADAPLDYGTLAQFESSFWRTARDNDEVVLSAKVAHQTPDMVVLDLKSAHYQGGAHGILGNQYLNWQRSSGRLLALDEVLIPGRHDAFVERLRQAHAQWLAQNEDARSDPDTYSQRWPFTPSDNYALLADGVAIRYQPYVIAPYSYGQPVLTLPYAQLEGILKPVFLPRD